MTKVDTTAEFNRRVGIAHPFHNEAIEARVLSILRSGRLVQGECVNEFETALKEYIGSRNVVAVSSGTAALLSAMIALKLSSLPEHKDEVITSPLSFAATANAIVQAGCKPVFVDVDPRSFNMDPSLVGSRVNDRTLAIEPVDVYGLPADLERINKNAGRDVPIIEDAAEAIGATYGGKRIGNIISTLSCFSTYATKNLHTGEGGFVTTNDDELAKKVRLVRNQGQVSRYVQTVLGYNFRMLETSAAIGLEQVRVLDELNNKRMRNALYLKSELQKFSCFDFQLCSNPKESAWYMFSITLDEARARIKRDELVSSLRKMGVEADVSWPTPIHLQPYYKEVFGFKEGDFPVAETLCRSLFQLPIHPFLQDDDLSRIVSCVELVLREQ